MLPKERQTILFSATLKKNRKLRFTNFKQSNTEINPKGQNNNLQNLEDIL